ncbi:hypothetical protein [Pedobacter alluvionis]|uniref:Uncharacterized protein n=1 Tax=Pedobacter alluvionis TaxID=475253 RepID=A0A497Y8D2_9SPHI|nr:hypothetical protein [Pedobacter alluvionis]RLJ79435.1 hypothetical protein BCL90_0129 [Pedobacter alluvionis]TFB30784.1 hypothetical protein E3V97_09095 [Pedobacter alluvionis]
MVRTREDSFFKIRSAVPEHFPLLLLLLLAFFFLRPSHLTRDLVQRIFSISTTSTSIVSPISGEDQQQASLAALDQKQPKFRKKFQHLNDVASDVQPFQKHLEIHYHLPVSNLTGYETPHFFCGQHAFLYRLTYF